jgi:hypothetical protein
VPFRSLESNTEILVTLKREEKKPGGTREETSLSLSRVERVDGTGLDRPNTLPNMMMSSTPRDLSSSGRSKSLKPAGDPNQIRDSTAQHSTAQHPQKKKIKLNTKAFTIEKIADDREKSLEKRRRVQLGETIKRTRRNPPENGRGRNHKTTFTREREEFPASRGEDDGLPKPQILAQTRHLGTYTMSPTPPAAFSISEGHDEVNRT